MVRPGYNPHTFDPSPQLIGALAKAVLYVRVGLPFEDAWMDRLRSANPQMQVLDVSSGLELRSMESHGHDDESDGDGSSAPDHGHGHDRDEDHDEHEADQSGDAHHHADPHVWTSPPLVKHMAGTIRDKLAELDPAHTADFARNHDAFIRELDALDRDIRILLDPLTNRKFMVFHPAWGYFADTYDLIQVPIEREGKQPGARALAALIDQAQRENVRVVFVQPQFDRRQAEQVAQAMGGSVVAVDPLAADYIDNLREVARQFAEALRP
jgi:zinc transport system substrate-binding protein